MREGGNVMLPFKPTEPVMYYCTPLAVWLFGSTLRKAVNKISILIMHISNSVYSNYTLLKQVYIFLF